jgi:hypothetical protein
MQSKQFNITNPTRPQGGHSHAAQRVRGAKETQPVGMEI